MAVRRWLPYASLALWAILTDAWFGGPLFHTHRPAFAAAFSALLAATIVVYARAEVESILDRRLAGGIGATLLLATLIRLLRFSPRTA